MGTSKVVVPTNRELCHRSRALLSAAGTDFQPPRGKAALIELDKWVRIVETDDGMRTSNGVTTGLLEACRACLDTVTEHHRSWEQRDRIGAAKDALAMTLRQLDQAYETHRRQNMTDWSTFSTSRT